MTRHAFFIAGDRVIHIANAAGAGLQYRAQASELFPDEQVEAQKHDTAETVLVIRSGTVEVMVNGATGVVKAGSFVRIPPGAWFAYRNPGNDVARLLSRTAPLAPERRARRVSIRIAAA